MDCWAMLLTRITFRFIEFDGQDVGRKTEQRKKFYLIFVVLSHGHEYSLDQVKTNMDGHFEENN